MHMNQTVTIRHLLAGPRKQEVTGGTIVGVTHNGKRVQVACDAGIRVFHASIRSGVFYEIGNKDFRLVA